MSETFLWAGVRLPYFDHRYNHTRLNMRRVEVPIARWYVAQVPRGGRIVEVGNVLAHYGKVKWPVVDVREKGCINRDVMVWKPDELVDLVVCISTLEHVEARPRDVVARLRSFLRPGGCGVVTVPTAFRREVDEELAGRSMGAERVWGMKAVAPAEERVGIASGRSTGPRNDIAYEWVECSVADALVQSRRACAGRWSGGLVIMEIAAA